MKKQVTRGDTFKQIDRELKRVGSHWDLYSLVARHRLLKDHFLSWDSIAVLIYSMTYILVSGEAIRKKFTADGNFISKERFKL